MHDTVTAALVHRQPARSRGRGTALAVRAAAAGLLLAGVASTAPAVAAIPDHREPPPPPPPSSVPCDVDPSMLPRTADAAAAWMAACRG